MPDLSILPESSESTFFFPLRTNVQCFDTAEARLKLEERIKQASLLHDKLLFEGGVYTATAWEEGSGRTFDWCAARVRQLVLKGELAAQKFGRDLMINAEAIAKAKKSKTTLGPLAARKDAKTTSLRQKGDGHLTCGEQVGKRQ
jgi:hypothetical protein